MPTTTALSFPPPSGSWKNTLPVWACLAMDRRMSGWRSRYVGAGMGLSHLGAIRVDLTGRHSVVVVKGR